MGAPKGNQYAAKERVWCSAIDQALEKRGKKLGRMGALMELADKLLDNAMAGDMAALKELGDRMDGKPQQTLDATVSGAMSYEGIPTPVSERDPLDATGGPAGTGDTETRRH